jgi:hypothetical protein
MSPAMAAGPQKPRRRIWPFLVGCAALVVLGCSAIGIGVYFFARDWFDQNLAGLLPGTEEPAVAYILDTSSRMGLPSEQGTRLAVAQAILAEIVRPADPKMTSGLRVFGGGALPAACEDTELVVSFAPANQTAVADGALGLHVGAATESALAQSMVAAIRDLNSARGPHSIVVVTGGADSCNPQAGELLAREAAAAGIDLQTYVIGFQVPPEEAEALKTLAAAAPGGTYYDAVDADSLRLVLGTIQRTIEQPDLASRLIGAQATVVAEQPEEEPSGGGESQPTDGYESQTACDHPYFPLRQGASWSYSGGDVGYSWTVSSVSGDLSSATASVTMGFEGGSVTFEWSCDSSGVLFYQFGSLSSEDLGGIATFQITSHNGAPLINPEGLESGASWTSDYTMSYEVGVEGFSTAFTSTVQESHSAGSVQELSTAVGTFQAIPVTTNSTSTTTSDFGTFPVTYTSVCWFGYGVGMLRCETSGEGFSEVTELTSYTIP